MDEDQETICCKDGRSLRKRTKKIEFPSKKRRSSLAKEDAELEVNLEEIYLQQKDTVSNFRPSSLETIYESPKGKNDSKKTLMGIVKLKRQCNFSPFYNPPKFKIKQRKKRAKSVKRVGIKTLCTTVSIETIQKIINELSDSENDENLINISSKPAIKNENEWCYRNNIIYPDDSYTAINKLSSNLADMNMEPTATGTISVVSEMEKSFTPDSVSSLRLNFKPKEIEMLEINDFCSPQLTEKEKQRKHRRRSGRVEISSFNIDKHSLISMNSNVKKPEDENNVLNNLCNNSKFVPPSLYPKISLDIQDSDLKCKNNETRDVPLSNSSSCKKSFKGKQKRGKTRRVSGVTRPLYKSMLNVSMEDPNLNIANSSLNSSPSPNIIRSVLGTPSPSSLFKELRLSSPSSGGVCKAKSTRRRSARLNRSVEFGSVWSQQSPSSSLQLSPKNVYELTPKTIFPTNKTLDQESNFNGSHFDSSPIISGMFDSKAIIVKGRKMKKDESISLKQFKATPMDL